MSLFSSIVVPDNITNTEFLILQPTIALKDPDGKPLTSGGNVYDNVPLNSTMELTIDFELPDGDGTEDYDYDGGEYFEITMPAGMSYTGTTVGTVMANHTGTGGSYTYPLATWEIVGDKLIVTLTGASAEHGGAANDNHWDKKGQIILNGTFGSTGAGDTNVRTIVIGDTTYTINLETPEDPEPEPEVIGVAKSGSYDMTTNEITWTVTVTPPEGVEDLHDYVLKDVYSDNQTYVENSFYVGNENVLDSNSSLSFDSANTITYEFPEGSTGVQTITYKTKPTSTVLNKTDTFANTASIEKDGDVKGGPVTGTVTIENLFKKENTSASAEAPGVMEWKVTVDIPVIEGATQLLLPKAKIIDTMDNRLKLDEASVKISFDGGTTSTPVSKGTTAGTAGTYDYVGDVLTYNFPANQPYTGTKVVLTYKTEVKDWETTMGDNAAVTFTNNAKFEWDPDGEGEGPAISIGAGVEKNLAGSHRLLSKDRATEYANNVEYDNTSDVNGNYIKWKVVVNQTGITMPADAKIVDTVALGHKLVIDETHPMTVSKNGKEAQTYNPTGPTTGAHGALTYDATSASGTFTFAFNSATSDSYTFEFFTELINQTDLYRNTSNTQTYTNNVKLFYGTTEKASDDASRTYKLEMLKKDVGTYNYADRTVMWTLTVNRNRLNVSGATIEDTLPTGMTMLVDIDHPFTVKDSKGDATVTGVLVTGASGFTITLPEGTDNVNTEKYTITYYSKVTDDEVLETQGEIKFTNKAVLGTLPGNKTVTVEKELKINNPIISKGNTYSTTKASDPGTITWVVDINPGLLDLTGAFVSDTLSDKLKLVGESVKLYKVAVNPGGSLAAYNESGRVPFAAGDLTIDGQTFTVNLPNGAFAYKLVFDTVIVDDTGSAANTISLNGVTDGPITSTVDSVNINNVLSGGSSGSYFITVTKENADGTKTLSGAKFSLLNAKQNPFKNSTATTGADGTAKFDNLPNWVFYVREDTPPYGYLKGTAPIQGPYLVTDKHEYTFNNAEASAAVSINKVGATGTILEGGNFTLTGTDYKDDLVSLSTAADEGVVKFENVPMPKEGTVYIIRETEAPVGHNKSDTLIYVKIGYAKTSGETADYTAVVVTYSTTENGTYTTTVPTLTNTPEPTGENNSEELSFTKTDADGNPLAGAKFELRTNNAGATATKVGDPVTSGSDGKVVFPDVPIGEYAIYETTTPAGYLNPNDSPDTEPIINVIVRYNNTNEPTEGTLANTRLVVDMTAGSGAGDAFDAEARTFTNTPAVADVEFTKISSLEPEVPGESPEPYSFNGSGVSLFSSTPVIKINGGQFKISGESELGPYEDTATAVDGNVKFKNVPVSKAGEYYTIEEISPPSGYFKTNEKLYVKVVYTENNTDTTVEFGTVEFDDFISDDESADPELVNEPIPYIPGEGEAIITKVDEDGKTLAGAIFTLYNSAGKEVASMTTGTDGKAIFTKLTPDTSYTIRETAAPEGYELSDETFTFKTGDKTSHEFTMVNIKLPEKLGSVRINKVDEDGKALAGATFTLYDGDGEPVGTKVTGIDGIVSFTNLALGNYSVGETDAPEGYELYDETKSFTITDNQLSFEFTLINVKEDSDVGGWEDEKPDEPDEPDVPDVPDKPDEPEGTGGADEKLPQTGGIPASFWLLMSGAILITAGLLSLKSKEKKAKHLKKSK